MEPNVQETNTNISPEPEMASGEILCLDETARFLRISRPTLLELAKRKQIPARQVGVQWRFHREALLDWLAGNDRVSHSRRKK